LIGVFCGWVEDEEAEEEEEDIVVEVLLLPVLSALFNCGSLMLALEEVVEEEEGTVTTVVRTSIVNGAEDNFAPDVRDLVNAAPEPPIAAATTGPLLTAGGSGKAAFKYRPIVMAFLRADSHSTISSLDPHWSAQVRYNSRSLFVDDPDPDPDPPGLEALWLVPKESPVNDFLDFKAMADAGDGTDDLIFVRTSMTHRPCSETKACEVSSSSSLATGTSWEEEKPFGFPGLDDPKVKNEVKELIDDFWGEEAAEVGVPTWGDAMDVMDAM
jgi:hypothetical protein